MVVYCITHRQSGKQYVGITKYDIDKRLYGHLRPNNKSLISLALKKYGKDNFSLEIIETVFEREKLNEREIFWIDKLETLHPKGYNLHGGGISSEGWKLEELTRKAISESRKGWVYSEKTKEKISKTKKGMISTFKGKKHSKETKLKMSDSKKGKPSHRLGKKLTEEHKKRISESHKKRYL